MIKIDITTFSNNINKYSLLAKNQDLLITEDDKILFVVKGIKDSRQEAYYSLKGLINSNKNYETILENRISEI